ncbi:hypothetical protein BDR26DRAFT_869265 [Obelidium mucronatum]|nr:hypothetical protein BDR26DRAFT_869265 [Obelidium mucronatum]
MDDDTLSQSSRALVFSSLELHLYDSQDRQVETLPQIVAFYFGASWSPACTEFHPYLLNSYSKHSQSASIVYISADHSEDGHDSMLAGTQFLRLPFPLSKPTSDHFRNVRKALGIATLPSLVVLNTSTKRVISVDGVNEINIFGSLAWENWIHGSDPWPASWVIGAKMFYKSVEQQVLRITSSVLSFLVGRQRLIGPASASSSNNGIDSDAETGTFRGFLRLVFGIEQHQSQRRQQQQHQQQGSPAETLVDNLPPTIHPSQMNADDSEGSIMNDNVSIHSASTSKTGMYDERFRFPLPTANSDLSASALSLRTPPPSPIPILKRTSGAGGAGGAESFMSASGMSTISLDASMINLSDSMLSDFRGTRRDSVFSNLSPDASMIHMSDSMMSDFRGSRRKVSFSQGLEQYLEESGASGSASGSGSASQTGSRKTVGMGDSMVVIERGGVWDE